jgi:NADH-quinone oxidoreductase subunit N
MESVVRPEINLMAIAPEIVLLAFAFLMLIFTPMLGRSNAKSGGIISLIAIAAAFVVNIFVKDMDFSTLGGMIVIDTFSVYFNAIILLASFITVVISLGYIGHFGILDGEFYLLMLFSTSGMMLMGSATDVLSIFIALELMSIPIYVLVGFRRDNLRAREASYKYFILGALSTGIFVYGAALAYGSAGGTNLFLLADSIISGWTDPLLLLGATFLVAGFLFKVSAVPFHMWTPDVYEGASMPITAFMSVGVKAAAFSALARFAVVDLGASGGGWIVAVGAVAVASMILGNTAALTQNNIKRLLAYSSIAHVGYILVALITVSTDGIAAVLFYILLYVIVNLGIFAILIYFSKKDVECEMVEDLNGLGYKYPVMALAMGVFMFSLAGIPPTGGFMGKLYLFAAAVKGGYLWLVVIAVLASGVSVYYYLRVMMALFKRDGSDRGMIKNPIVALIAVITALAALYLGVLPGYFMDLARSCASALF